jgi:BirA family biotin operon repressor/biotin-[acetyl-CoA-carboxylase] ligase
VSVVVDASATPQASPPAIWSLACGVALAEAVAALVPTIEPLVRWPNDVEVNGRKLAGILVETTPGGRAIFGIGVNTTGSCRDVPPPLDTRLVTLPDLTGSILPRQSLLVEFLPRLFRLLAATADDPEAFVPRYRARCGLDGQPVTVFSGDERLTGICRGIAADGRLMLDTPGGRVHVTSGSLTHPADVWRGD